MTAAWLAFAKAAGERLLANGQGLEVPLDRQQLGRALLAGVAAAEAVETDECTNCGERVPPGCGGEFSGDAECALHAVPPSSHPFPGDEPVVRAWVARGHDGTWLFDAPPVFYNGKWCSTTSKVSCLRMFADPLLGTTSGPTACVEVEIRRVRKEGA